MFVWYNRAFFFKAGSDEAELCLQSQLDTDNEVFSMLSPFLLALVGPASGILDSQRNEKFSFGVIKCSDDKSI